MAIDWVASPSRRLTFRPLWLKDRVYVAEKPIGHCMLFLSLTLNCKSRKSSEAGPSAPLRSRLKEADDGLCIFVPSTGDTGKALAMHTRADCLSSGGLEGAMGSPRLLGRITESRPRSCSFVSTQCSYSRGLAYTLRIFVAASQTSHADFLGAYLVGLDGVKHRHSHSHAGCIQKSADGRDAGALVRGDVHELRCEPDRFLHADHTVKTRLLHQTYIADPRCLAFCRFCTFLFAL